MPIALLTDFGSRDHFVGAMKGVILSIDPTAEMVDITHEIGRQDVAEAAFTLAACDQSFPTGTIFLCVVDPGVGSSRRAVAVECSGRIYVTPDNGSLTHVLSRGEAFRAFELTNLRYRASTVSNTFHGRDIFAPAAAHLSCGVALNEFGSEAHDLVRLPFNKPKAQGNQLNGAVIHVDHFGNLVTNITPNDVSGRMAATLNGRRISREFTSYAEAVEGEPFLIWGSAGFLEIAVNRGSAADLLKAHVESPLLLEFSAREL